MTGPPATSWSGGAGVTAEVTRSAAARIADDAIPALPRIRPTGYKPPACRVPPPVRGRTASEDFPDRRESELAIACCESTVSYGGTVRSCWPDNSIGDDRFRLRWSNQGKRAEGCGCDLVNPVAANQ